MGSLHTCLDEQRYHQFLYLVNLRCDLNELDGKLNTPLIKICSSIDNIQISLKLLKILLANGANTDVEDEEGLTPLHIACKRNIPEMASLLLKYFTDCPVNSKDMYGNTPLHYAVAHHETTLVKLLLPYLTRYKVNADSRNKSGFTPLLIAASYGRLEVARYMIQKVNVSKVVYDSLYFLSVDDWFHIYYDWPTSTDVLDPDTTVTRRSHNDIEFEKKNLTPIFTKPAFTEFYSLMSRENSGVLKQRSIACRSTVPRTLTAEFNTRPRTAPMTNITEKKTSVLGAAIKPSRGKKITLKINSKGNGWVKSKREESKEAMSIEEAHHYNKKKLQETYWGDMINLTDIYSQQMSDSYRRTIIPTWSEPESAEDPNLLASFLAKQLKDKPGTRAASIVMSVLTTTKNRKLPSESSAPVVDEESIIQKGSIKARLLKYRKTIADKSSEGEEKINDDMTESERVEKAAAILSRVVKRKSLTKIPFLHTQASVTSSTPQSP